MLGGWKDERRRERQPGNANVMEDENGGGGGEGGVRKVGMKVREENTMPRIENERGSEKRKW